MCNRSWLTCLGAIGLSFHAQVALAQADYPGALWDQADTSNFAVANRPITWPIEYVIIHIMEGTYAGSISWFNNPASGVSAHYCVRSSDGQITQMVRNKDRAFHAGNTFYNQRGIGIEHEGRTATTSAYPNPAMWHTDIMYSESAELTRWLCGQYSIPRTRTYILGHGQVSSTSCPSIYWDWNRYMAFVTQGANYTGTTWPQNMAAGQVLNVQFQFSNGSEFAWQTTAGPDQVTLRTVPNGTASNFFVAGSWINSSQFATANAVTAVGQTATFQATIQAPLTPGPRTETFQLYRESTGFFGPQVTLTTTVGQMDLVMENTDPAVRYSGTWSTGTSATDKSGSDYRFFSVTPKTSAMATWNVTVPESGFYDVYAWWPQGTNRTAAANMQIWHRRGVLQRSFNQQTNGGRWNLIGRVPLNPEISNTVRILGSSSSPGVVMADAIRVVGPIR